MSSFRKKAAKTQESKMSGRCKYCESMSVSARGVCSRCTFLQPRLSAKMIKEIQKGYKKSFQRIFILTLSNKVSRWNLFEQRTLPHLNRYSCIKYIGVDGRDMEAVFDATATLLPNEPKEVYEDILKKREKYAGSIGCYLSHMMIWKQAYDTKQSNEEFVLILEDDAKFEPYGVQNMERLLHTLRDAEFDILYLGHSPILKGTKISPLLMGPPKKSEPQYRTNCGFWGYIIRVASVPNLLNAVRSFQDQSIDETIQRQFGELVDALFLINPLVTQSSFYSVRVTMDQKKC